MNLQVMKLLLQGVNCRRCSHRDGEDDCWICLKKGSPIMKPGAEVCHEFEETNDAKTS